MGRNPKTYEKCPSGVPVSMEKYGIFPVFRAGFPSFSMPVFSLFLRLPLCRFPARFSVRSPLCNQAVIALPK